jgi:hypothetical protein
MVRWIPATVQAFIVLIVVIMRVKLHVQAFIVLISHSVAFMNGMNGMKVGSMMSWLVRAVRGIVRALASNLSLVFCVAFTKYLRVTSGLTERMGRQSGKRHAGKNSVDTSFNGKSVIVSGCGQGIPATVQLRSLNFTFAWICLQDMSNTYCLMQVIR